MKKRSIAILYICTGKYSIFWKKFYESCEQFFLPEAEKKYFVFSDTLDQDECAGNVEIIYQKKMGWPDDTLKRFHLFDSIKTRLKDFDYLFFFNANMVFKKIISEDILTINGSPAELIVVLHPFFNWVHHPKDFPYERRKKSTAYLGYDEGSAYVFGAFNGGQSNAYLEMVEELKKNIDRDLDKNIIAIWHDESQLNRYIWSTKRNVNYLDSNYAYPEGEDFEMKNDVFATVLDKKNFGGHDFLRDKENSIPVQPHGTPTFLQKIKRRFRRKHAR